VPQIDVQICDRCGRCVDLCHRHAIARAGEEVIVFPELCDGCGACHAQCPQEAISEIPYIVGKMARGRVGSMHFLQGTMDVDAISPLPVIREVKRQLLELDKGRDGDRLAIIDAPAGPTPAVAEVLHGSDVALLVTEPTPSALRDLQRIAEVGRDLGTALGVIINKEGAEYPGIAEYCETRDIPILMRVPFQRGIAEAYACGKPLIAAFPTYRHEFLNLYDQIVEGLVK